MIRNCSLTCNPPCILESNLVTLKIQWPQLIQSLGMQNRQGCAVAHNHNGRIDLQIHLPQVWGIAICRKTLSCSVDSHSVTSRLSTPYLSSESVSISKYSRGLLQTDFPRLSLVFVLRAKQNKKQKNPQSVLSCNLCDHLCSFKPRI